MFEYLVMGISLVAAILAIANYFKGFIKYKAVIFILATLLSASAVYQIILVQEKNSAELIATEMKKSAKMVADSILITGWEETGDYLGYLTQITGFYVSYQSFFPVEAKTYSNELSEWREFFSEKRKVREIIYSTEIDTLRGLVKSAEEHLEKISDAPISKTLAHKVGVRNMTDVEFWTLLVRIVTAIGTLLVAALAIWGDWIRFNFAGPKLHLSLHDPGGEPSGFTDGKTSRHYHLKVRNQRKWVPAKNVRVVLTKVIKYGANGSLLPESLSGPIQLTWQFPQTHALYSLIGPDDICDLGFVTAGDKFTLCTYIVPTKLDRVIEPEQKIYIEVIAIADNAESNILCINIAWDGKWSDDTSEMKEHLVIKEIACATGS